MCTRILKFFDKNNVKFGFRQKYSTTHVLINLAENIGKY